MKFQAETALGRTSCTAEKTIVGRSKPGQYPVLAEKFA
jgi:hypothetical protein